MFRFQKVILNNFGCYGGEKTIDFPDEDGVVIIWCENGFGKTTLLRAIIFAFTGRLDDIPDYDGQNHKFKDVINTDSWKAKDYSFSVRVFFVYNDNEYEIKRSVKIKEKISEPTSDKDYDVKFGVKQDTVSLGPADADKIRNSVMPEGVERFFLFDGEYLEKYESLLYEKTSNMHIKESIERILGAPVLTNSYNHINQLLENYNELYQKELGKDEKNKKFSADLARLNEELKTLYQEKQSLEQEIIDDKNEISNINSVLSSNISYKEILDAEEKHIKQRNEKIEEVKQCWSSIRDLLNNNLSSLCYNRVNECLQDFRQRQDELTKEHTKHAIFEENIKHMEEAYSNCYCEICLQKLDSDAKNHLKDELDRLKGKKSFVLSSEEEKELKMIGAQITNLDNLNIRHTLFVEPIVQYEKTISDDEIEIEKLNELINDDQAKRRMYEGNNNNKEGITPEKIKELTRKLAFLESNLPDKNRKLINKEDIEIKGKLTEIDNLQKKIKNDVSSEKLDKLSTMINIYKDLANVFRRGIDEYALVLKNKVEKCASDIFLSIRQQQDYVGLEINDNYGLQIKHESGEKVPVKSAGYGHIVALSLITALHINAPEEGPIVMDSPFGRLSFAHKRNVVRQLPNMGKQVIMLLYDDEVPREDIVKILGDKLLKEYRLEHSYAFQTNFGE